MLIQSEPVDLVAVLAQAVETSRPLIRARRHGLNVSAPETPVVVRGDHVRLVQVLSNLLNNAAKYTEVGGRIDLNLEPIGTVVDVSVSDNGIGISKENREKIFDRFFRAEDEAVQKVSGTGLGLAIVRSLIEMHGGYLQVESELGKGSTFSFNLPVVIEDSDPT